MRQNSCWPSFFGFAGTHKDLPNITSRVGADCIFAPMACIFKVRTCSFETDRS